METKMTGGEIERLVDEAIRKRPTVTTAPLNLYVVEGKVFCGARCVMPDDAIFITHVPPDRLKGGFETAEWKQIVEKILKAFGSAAAQYAERRREQRLRHNTDVWFTKDLKKAMCKGQMVDVSSDGMAFTCSLDSKHLYSGKEITANFSIPRLKWDDSLDTMSFARLCRIRRIEKVDNEVNHVAVQFSRPLPFKPGEQGIRKPSTQQAVTAITV